MNYQVTYTCPEHGLAAYNVGSSPEDAEHDASLALTCFGSKRGRRTCGRPLVVALTLKHLERQEVKA